VGVVVGIRDADPDVPALSARPSRTAPRRCCCGGRAADRIVAAARGGATFGRSIGVETGTVESPPRQRGQLRRFGATSDTEVVAVSRVIAGTDWVIAHKIDRAEARGNRSPAVAPAPGTAARHRGAGCR
jgi:hypothetical protein